MAIQHRTKQSLTQRWGDYEPTKSTLVWSCVGAAVAAMIVGFSWGGWVTGDISRTMAATAGDAPSGELVSAICVERFNAAPDAASNRAAFNALTDSYKKRPFVDFGGLVTVPGRTTSDWLGVQGCAIALAT